MDDLVTRAGFNYGFFYLLDQIGIDLVLNVFKTIKDAFPKTIDLKNSIGILEEMVQNNFLGSKSDIGFYLYKSIRERQKIVEGLGLPLKISNLMKFFDVKGSIFVTF